MMSLSDISIKHPVFAWMLMAGLIVFGAISFRSLGISQLPDVDFPVITVSITWPGATPDVMETAVADVVENAVMSVDGVQLVQSTSQQGSSQIRIDFNLSTNINDALSEVQARVAQAQRNLPTNIDPPVISKTNPEDQPILWVAAYTMGGPLRDLAIFVRDHLRDRITSVSGVGDVRLGGYVDPQMRVWLNNDKMVRLQITAQDVINAINAGNQLSPTGYQDLGPRESFVHVQSEFRNAAECDELLIPSRQGAPIWSTIQIKDVGHCALSTDDIRRISRFNGIQPTIGLGVVKQRGTNTVEIGDAVKARVAQLKDALPKGINMGIVVDSTKFIRESIEELFFTLGVSVLLTSLVCYLFLGSFSSAFNVILAIPVSLVGSLIFIRALGFTLNNFTLLALSLSIGIVVDDAIMVLENIARHHEQGMPRVRASLVGAREITSAAVAASLAILAIFVPVVFMQGIIGRFFYQFGIALSVAVMLSLIEALTFAPMRTSQFLRPAKVNRVTRVVNRGMDALTRAYRRSLEFALGWRKTVLASALGVFALSLLTAKSIRKEFLPPQDQSRFMVTLRTPMGSSLAFTDDVFKNAEAFMKARGEIDTYYVAVGGFAGGLVNQGIMFITMKDPGARPVAQPFKKRPSQQEFMGFARNELQKIKGVETVSMLDLSLTGFSAQRGYPIEFELQGPDWNKLTQLAGEMQKRLRASGLMADLDTDYNPNMPQTEIVPDLVKAAARGVQVSTIADAIATMVGGSRLLPNRYTDPSGHRDDIQVQLIAPQNRSAADINRIWVRNQQGEIVPLRDVVSIHQSKTLLTITRYNRQRAIGIFGNFAPGRSQNEVLGYIQKTAKEILPQGYTVTLAGSSQAFGESFRSLLGALVLGIFVAYIVLGSQFNSFLHPAIILLALPFSVTGALGAMWLTDTSLNIYSLIGILLLMGIVKKNSILLVDFTNARRRAGRTPNEALLDACPVRLRPILMTSIATVAAAIPQAAALGPGAETVRPMAISVIGGVFFSTALTLYVVPCAYSLFARFEGKKHEKELREALAAMGESEQARPAA